MKILFVIYSHRDLLTKEVSAEVMNEWIIIITIIIIIIIIIIYIIIINKCIATKGPLNKTITSIINLQVQLSFLDTKTMGSLVSYS